MPPSANEQVRTQGRRWLRLGDCWFDPASGELQREHPGRRESLGRLGPQPAALLGLLIHRGGALATREEIRREIWPDVQVSFDPSLHHCIRQIRSALGERARHPKYIETVPRRGYRLICEVSLGPKNEAAGEGPKPEADPVHAADRPSEAIVALAVPPQVPTQKPRTRWVAAVVLLMVVVTTWMIVATGGAPTRIAVMSFEDTSIPDESAAKISSLGERVLEGLTLELADSADLIGPRTTEPLQREGHHLREIAREIEVGYIVNTKHIGRVEGIDLLVEFIRTSDGKHIWVKYYERVGEPRDMAKEIVAGIVETLGKESGS